MPKIVQKTSRYPTAENQTKSTRKLPVRWSKIRRTAATRTVPIIPLSRISSLVPIFPVCDQRRNSTAIRIGRLRERRLDETFPAEVSDLETELPPPAPRSSTARAPSFARCEPEVRSTAGHCHVNRKFAGQMTMAATVHAATVAWRHVSIA